MEISDPRDADEFLEDAYGVPLHLRRTRSDHIEGAMLIHDRTTVGPFAVEDIFAAGSIKVAPDPLNKVLAVWVTGGRVTAECDGMTADAAPGEVTVLTQPHLPYRAHSQDCRLTTVLLDPAVVSSVATGVPAGQAPLPIRFTGFSPMDAAAARLWKNTVTYVKNTVLAEEALATPLVLGHASRLLAAVTLSTFPNSAVVAPRTCDRTDTKPVLLRRAMQFMDANAGSDIALSDVAEAIHVTPRAVQYMFRRHLETTPLQYLRRLRLHYAHQELLSADRGHSTVTEIAARWGFAHTGRFAVLYRQTYGQSPHATLRGI